LPRAPPPPFSHWQRTIGGIQRGAGGAPTPKANFSRALVFFFFFFFFHRGGLFPWGGGPPQPLRPNFPPKTPVALVGSGEPKFLSLGSHLRGVFPGGTGFFFFQNLGPRPTQPGGGVEKPPWPPKGPFRETFPAFFGFDGPFPFTGGGPGGGAIFGDGGGFSKKFFP